MEHPPTASPEDPNIKTQREILRRHGVELGAPQPEPVDSEMRDKHSQAPNKHDALAKVFGSEERLRAVKETARRRALGDPQD